MSLRDKSAHVLELPKILEQLSRHATFSAGIQLCLQLAPSYDLEEAQSWQQETTEARTLFEIKGEVSLGGARDVREATEHAQRGMALEPQTLLDIRSTLRRATIIRRTLSRLDHQFPVLAGIADRLEECQGLQTEISQVLNDNGDVMDSASPRLAIIRRDLRIAFDKLQSKLQSLVNNANNAKFLQEQLITQRHGRYVIPLRSDAKGRIPGVVHDQSSSGATIFVEPLATVELNNAVRQHELEEEQEVRRILLMLTEQVSHEAEFINLTVEGLAYLDLIFAKARYAGAIRANAPKLVPFRQKEDHHPGSTIKVEQARHPLLPSKLVVPIDLALDEQTYALVITGPNTGGKTVALKTIGLMTLMAQCGLHIPASAGAELSVFDGIYADIGDEQSIEQSLSTFSAHMTNTIQILSQVTPRSLVILDELGAGTDPAEGSALARAILNYLMERSATTLVTTHHPELKSYSQERSGVRNASVQFDLETLRPTYRLIVGIPGRSNALAIASRLGLPTEIVEEARGMVATEDLAADGLLDELVRTREETNQARDAALATQNEAEGIKRDLRQRLDELEIERRDVIAQTRRVAERELDELRAEVRKLRHALQAAGQPLEAIKRVEESAFELKNTIDTPVANVTKMPDGLDERPEFRVGEIVWVNGLNAEGEISELSSTDAEVMVGRLRVRAKVDDLQKRSERTEVNRKVNKRSPAVVSVAPSRERQRERPALRGTSPGLEIDLRGNTVEDAMSQVDGYLDAAYVSGLPFVRIIHGKGTGALRKAIRDMLHSHPLVQKYQRGDEKEGGDGVTVVNFVPQA